MRILALGVALTFLTVSACDCSGVAAAGDDDAGVDIGGATDAGGGDADAGSGDPDAGSEGCGQRTCASAGAECGPIGDGCSSILQCGTCSAPETCGGGGEASVCGGNGGGCVPRTCDDLGAECGPVGDGCGNVVECGTCADGLVCGGGGASRCGLPPGVDCTPLTCADVGATCGQVADGCGGLTADCGTCTGNDVCGGAGPNLCGPLGDACVPATCQDLGANCGQVADGCGGLTADCGACTGGDICGGGGLNVCGPPPGPGPCVARTCQDVGANCGPVADGCGGLTPDCGTCTLPDICGGGGTPSVCGNGGGGGGPTCTNLCLRQQQCPAGGTTSVTGTVFAPNGTDPIYNALVYVPNAPVDAFGPRAPGVCLQCDDEVSGSPLVSAITGPDGRFTLTNMPTGANVPLVIQLGRWRRQVTINNVPACTSTALPAALTRLPKNRAEGDIPLTAMVTGNVDALECVLRKMGIDDTEFDNPGGQNRIQIFQENGAIVDGNTPAAADALWNTQANIDRYDQVLFACEGREDTKPGAALTRILNYADGGGRVFTTHFSYTWTFENTPWGCGTNCSTAGDTIGIWQGGDGRPTTDSIVSTVDQSFGKGVDFSEWLDVVGASTAPGSGQVRVDIIRSNIDEVFPPGQRWLFTNDPDFPIQHMTFNTPVAAPADQQCGRVLFSDFHVADARTRDDPLFDACDNSPMTAQEKVLEFMLFDLASCISPDQGPPPSTCTPRTCAQANADCGPVADGCGGTLDCGQCAAGETCGAGGPSRCGGPSTCAPTDCSTLGAQCGPAGDGCGGVQQCGDCPAGQTCGAAGPSQCGGETCAPTTCAALGAECGAAGDGCGGVLACGDCPAGLICGGGGPSRCGGAACTPKTCADLGVECGPVADGCGGLVECGACAAPLTCGGAGQPGVCGQGPCTPTTCAAEGAECGPIADGCGGTLDCGTCPGGQAFCGVAAPNVCATIGG